MPEAPCRLFVYLARDARLGVVLRRGPSAWARLSLWHTDTDRFEHGQWLKGRVYERRCDVSLDGGLFVYFTRKNDSRAAADSWVAISRPPYFTALALWFVGGTYYTGAMFPDRQSLWLGFHQGPPDEGRLPPWLAVTPQPPLWVDQTSEWPERIVHFNRLLRDGWTLVSDTPDGTTWERPHPSESRTLVMTQRYDALMFNAYGGPYAVEYAVRAEAGGEPHRLGRASWADWDQQGRLVMARQGRLLHWESPDTSREIADFNEQVPEAAPAPSWALAWSNPPPDVG
jgi:hypothetical protein